MKFLCLCYYDPNVVNALSPEETQELTAACEPHYQAWENVGKVVALAGLSDVQMWKTVRPVDTPENTDNMPLVTNGPYISGGHRVGAFFIVEARDINEAVQIAAKHPSAHTGRFLGGGIEVCVCDSFELRTPTESST